MPKPSGIQLDVMVTDENFDEEQYLRNNPDVAKAVKQGAIANGWAHFDHFGRNEQRTMRLDSALLTTAKHDKLQRIAPLLLADLPHQVINGMYDFLTEELRHSFNIIDTEAISSHNYDSYGLALIEEFQHGLVLDCGSGRRPIYYENVVNFEIVDYDTTDVRGVGEALPFKDNAFDAVISVAVLEHVKDPFQCAREIIRVLKPHGKLMCCVPFLQPFHGYPHHYYNMTYQGLINLFNHGLEIDEVKVYESVGPIWSLTWFLNSWANGLHPDTRADFLNLTVADLIQQPETYLKTPFVTELSPEKNYELASANVLFAHKK